MGFGISVPYTFRQFLSLSLSLCICELKNIKKIDMHVNNNQIYLHDYCSNNLNLNVLIWVIFEVKCAKLYINYVSALNALNVAILLL